MNTKKSYYTIERKPKKNKIKRTSMKLISGSDYTTINLKIKPGPEED